MAVEIVDVSEDEFETWLRPREARQRMSNAFGNEKIAAEAIIQRLRSGDIKSAARSSTWETNTKTSEPTAIVYIPADHWRLFRDYEADKFWHIGDVQFRFSTHRDVLGNTLGSTVVFYNGVRVSLDGLNKWIADLSVQDTRESASIAAIIPAISLPPLDVQPPEAAPAPDINKRGRPRKDWWDDLWVEMCRQLLLGEVKPTRLAHIEKAMLDWLAAQGNYVSVTTIRPAARKLFNMLIRIDEK